MNLTESIDCDSEPLHWIPSHDSFEIWFRVGLKIHRYQWANAMNSPWTLLRSGNHRTYCAIWLQSSILRFNVAAATSSRLDVATPQYERLLVLESVIVNKRVAAHTQKHRDWHPWTSYQGSSITGEARIKCETMNVAIFILLNMTDWSIEVENQWLLESIRCSTEAVE